MRLCIPYLLLHKVKPRRSENLLLDPLMSARHRSSVVQSSGVSDVCVSPIMNVLTSNRLRLQRHSVHCECTACL